MYIYKRNNNYYLAFEKNGKVVRRSLKTSVKSEALQKFKAFNVITLSKKPIEISVKDFADRYEDYCGRIYTANYLRSVRTVMGQVKTYFNTHTIRSLSKYDIETFLFYIFTEHKHYALLIYRTLKAAFTKAIDWNLLEVNPCRGIKFPKIPKPHPAFIINKQLKKIIECESNATLRVIYEVAFFSGMRLSEIIKLRVKDIDFERKVISVVAENAKSGKERHIPIAPKLFKLLLPNKRNPRDAIIFGKQHDLPYRAEYVSKQFKKACVLAEIPSNIHFHSLRHSFASNLVIKGVSLYAVKELLGHADYATTQAYSHLESKSLQVAVRLL